MKDKGKSKKKNSNEKEEKVNSTQLVNISGGKNVKTEFNDENTTNIFRKE